MPLSNAETIRSRVLALSDLYGTRTPGDQAIGLWLETLGDMDNSALSTAFGSWAKTHNRMPTPADIRKTAMDIASAWLEAEAKRNNDSRADRGSVRQWVRDTAPELVKKSMHLFLSQNRPRRASQNDYCIANAVRRTMTVREFEDKDGKVILVTRTVDTPLYVIKRAEELAEGQLSSANAKVAQALARVKADEDRKANCATFDSILANERAKIRPVKAQRQEPPRPQFWNDDPF